jgi:hypothetical protein
MRRTLVAFASHSYIINAGEVSIELAIGKCPVAGGLGCMSEGQTFYSMVVTELGQ